MISILIRAGNGNNTLDCISSIKRTSPNSKIFISIVSDKRLAKKISKLGIKCCVVPKGNISNTTNKGLAMIRSRKVLITDSDTVFSEDCIKLLDAALNRYDVAKPLLVFKTNQSILSVLVANLRTYFNSNNKKMFTPGLAFKMSIKKKIGGYYFDNKVTWAEDSEFSDRLKRFSLKTFVEKQAKLFHPPINVSHDLAGAFLIGAKKPETKSLSGIISKRITTYSKIYQTFGILTLIYGLIWYAFFDFGKISKHTGTIGEKIQNYFWKL